MTFYPPLNSLEKKVITPNMCTYYRKGTDVVTHKLLPSSPCVHKSTSSTPFFIDSDDKHATLLLRKRTIDPNDKVLKSSKSMSPRSMSPWSRNKDARKVELTEEEIAKYYHCPQPVAALLLGVSLSSLKRRYYEIAKKKDEHSRRWPYQSLTIKERKQFIYYVLNCKEPENCTELDQETIDTLKIAFRNHVKRIQV